MKALSLSGPLVTAAALPCSFGRWNVGRARGAQEENPAPCVTDGSRDRGGRIAGGRERKKLVNLKIEAQG